MSDSIVIALGWVTVVAGAGLVVLGNRGLRAAQPFCARCWHPIHPGGAVVGQVCVECGTAFGRATDIATRYRRPMFKWIGLILTLVGATLCIGLERRIAVLKRILPLTKVESTQTLGLCEVTIYAPCWPSDASERRIEVRLDGNVVYATNAFYPSAGLASFERVLTEGNSFGDGKLRDLLWVRFDSGGSGGFSDTYFFEAEPGGEFLPAAITHNGSLEGARSDDWFDGSVWRQTDLSYRYRWTSGFAGPQPTLRGIPGDDGLMFLTPLPAEAPTAEQLAQLRATVANAPLDAGARDTILGATLSGFFDLVYSGRAVDAWVFFRGCFNDGIARLIADAKPEGEDSGGFREEQLPRTREAWEAMLLEAMLESEFIVELQGRNGGSIAPPSTEPSTRE